MFLIVGLGNPGEKYDKTRHNIGFDSIEFIKNKYNIDLNRRKFKGIYGDGIIANEKVILLKPETYMNLSGESIREVCNFYKIDNKNIIVIYDDVSLEVGRLRIRNKGSAGGHNGIKSIISEISTDEFPRIKVGVGQPQYNLVDHVLGTFNTEDRQVIEKVFNVVSDSVECIIKSNVQEAMNKYNGTNII
jgi:PTH1 family peptidyl-tRNA hydrolase